VLYRPVKSFLEGLGFAVKGEIGGCDLLALRGNDPSVVVIGELRMTFNLERAPQEARQDLAFNRRVQEHRSRPTDVWP
jgi:hypothetical protein